MADHRKDCLDEILEALGGRLKRDDVWDHLEDIDAKAEAYQQDGMARAEALRRATEETLKEASIRNAIMLRNAREDAIKFRGLRQYVDAAAKNGHGMELAIEARLTGVNTPMFDPTSRQGNQMSAAAMSLGAQKDWVGGFVTDVERLAHDNPKFAGLDKIFYSRAIEDDIFREKWEFDAGVKGKPGVTKNEQALEIARLMHKWDKVRVDNLNSEGAWITDYSGYMTKMTHDPDRIRKAADQSPFSMRKGFEQRDREAWVHFTLKHIDARRTFGGAEADQALAHMYGGFASGDHLELDTLSGEPLVQNVAAKVSAKRTLHWKSADSYLAYAKEYGRFSPTDAWLNSVKSSANHYALMKTFGSEPKKVFEEIVSYARNATMGTADRARIDKAAPKAGGGMLRNRFAVISGEADMPIANSWSGIVNGIMAVQRTSKLGFTPFAMLQDNVTISTELRRHGLGFLERNASILDGYFRGAEGSAKAEVADLLHTGILGRLRGVTARFDISDARSGTMAKMENTFFKITGITAMTENKRADSERMMAYAMGKKRGKEFADLGEYETNLMQGFGIGDKEWKLLHRAEWNTIDGKTYLTPDVAKKISDEDALEYMKAIGSITDRAESTVMLQLAGHVPGSAADRVKQTLALKLWAYYSERGNFAVLEPGAREKAILYQGTQAGSPLNLALRLMLQFKQFPTTMIAKTWGTEVHGGGTTMGRIAGITELVVGSTIAGILANYLNPLAKGQDPNAPWRNQPVQALMAGFLRGGAATIYGDFLMGEWSRFGLSATGTLVGPSFGQIDKLMEIWTDLTHAKKGSKTAALSAKFVRDNLPYMNMIYTRAAFDYMITYRLQEWLNPGYLQRMESGMKSRSGTEFLLRPSQVSR